MNDHFKLLAEQATDWCLAHCAEFDTNAWQWERKFAELVVNDCLDTMHQVAAKANRIEFTTEVLFNKAIKEKFGIKE